jgi:thymidylate synthase (FAD)
VSVQLFDVSAASIPEKIHTFSPQSALIAHRTTMTKVQVLDHGYLSYIDHMGSDESIIEAARMSTDKGFISWDPYEGHPHGDEGLLKHLYTKKHSTPFEMAAMVIEVQAPILVIRQWHRHRTQSYNEMSSRYTPLPDVNWRPTAGRCIPVSTVNRQAQGTSKRIPTHEEILDWLTNLDAVYEHSQHVYQQGLDLGIPKEVARAPVPVARYTRMRAQANLKNWLGFLTLRRDPHAQEEIRVYALAVSDIIRRIYPRTWKLWLDNRSW